LAAGDRRALAIAADRIDAELAVDPDLKGRELGTWRFFNVAPLGVVYFVNPPDRVATILDVWIEPSEEPEVE
jgi:hypothetical protein